MRGLIPTKSNGNSSLMGKSIRQLPWAPDRLFEQMLSDIWGSGQSSAPRNDGAPLEIIELEDVIRISVEVPGIAPDQLDISLTGQVLTLAGEKRDAYEGQAEHRTYSERQFGTLHRSIELPCPVEADGVKAEHEHGVVTVTLQKSEAVRPKRIRIESA